jgi:ActR/RegA family two-component response regulator
MSKTRLGTTPPDPSDDLHKAALELIEAKSKKLLLVEDTAAHALIVSRAIDASIWDFKHVTRGDAALQTYVQDPSRIVLLDLSLPDASGLDVLRQMLQINSQAVVIVVTSIDQVHTSVEAMKIGACNYVVKADPTETSSNISKAIEEAWQTRLRKSEYCLLEKSKLIELVRTERLEAIELVVRTVCHEVNNPLSGVMALSQLLSKSSDLDGDLQRLADGIYGSALEVSEVIKKLHNLSDTPS